MNPTEATTANTLEALEPQNVEPIQNNEKLRPYQKALINELYREINTWNTPSEDKHKQYIQPSTLLYLPTGGGKTRVAVYLVLQLLKNDPTFETWFIVNRNTLAIQAEKVFKDVGIHVGFFKAGKDENNTAQVKIASIQTLQTRYLSDYDNTHTDNLIQKISNKLKLIIVDEAHSAISQTYLTLFSALGILKNNTEHSSYKKAPFLLGLTATPIRLRSDEQLSKLFSSLLRGPSISQLIDSKVLVPPIVFSVDDTENDALFKNLIFKWKERAEGRATIAFAADVAHSLALVEAFNQESIASAHIDGTTSEEDRQQIFESLTNGKILILSSVGALSEGFDCPRISCVLLLRPTQSKALYLQQLGRGLRSFPNKKDCIVLDAAGNTLRHGAVHGPIGCENEWESDEEETISSFETEQENLEEKKDDDFDKLDDLADALNALSIKNKKNEKENIDKIQLFRSCNNKSINNLNDSLNTKKILSKKSNMKEIAWICSNKSCRNINHTGSRACSICAKVRPMSENSYMERNFFSSNYYDKDHKRNPYNMNNIKENLPRRADEKMNIKQVSKVSFHEDYSKVAISQIDKPRSIRITIPKKSDHLSAVESEVNKNLSLTSPGETIKIENLNIVEAKVLDTRTQDISTVVSSNNDSTNNTIKEESALPKEKINIFSFTTFLTALEKQNLPKFDLSYARNEWEENFLYSIARLITPGQYHPFKKNKFQSLNLSPGQQRVLLKIIHIKNSLDKKK